MLSVFVEITTNKFRGMHRRNHERQLSAGIETAIHGEEGFIKN